ncbi:MAG: hypothetical protein JSV69_11890 [Chloroflexota bacterium]|nr:MAG: hypothetical protein JSV69_11890 [Chloroflexota bacterium]
MIENLHDVSLSWLGRDGSAYQNTANEVPIFEARFGLIVKEFKGTT